MRRALTRHGHGTLSLGAWLIAFALALRVIVPTGWMPTFDNGAFSITLCSGSGPVEMTVDRDGTVHKKTPASAPQGDHACTFSGLGSALIGPALLPDLAPVLFRPAVAGPMRIAEVAIGQGLAAPPPPPTGPPSIL